MTAGDPFHTACPTIETMGDPFALAGSRNDTTKPRFTYGRTRSWDQDVFVINDNHLNKHTVVRHREHHVDRICRDLNEAYSRGCRFHGSDLIWHNCLYT